MNFLAVLGVLAIAGGLTLAPSRVPDRNRKLPEPGCHRLTQEIRALRTMFSLRMTTPQLHALQKQAKETMDKEREYKKGKISDDLRGVLGDYRRALVEAEDEERISELDEKVSDLYEAERPEVDDHFDITDAARARVPAIYKLLKPNQLVVYFYTEIEDILDPQDELVAYLEEIRESKPADWEEVRDEVAKKLGWLVGGLDAGQAAKVSAGVTELLTRARKLSDEEFKSLKPKLEEKARKTIGEVDSTLVLRHHLERTLAELLSNPRLQEALQAR